MKFRIRETMISLAQLLVDPGVRFGVAWLPAFTFVRPLAAHFEDGQWFLPGIGNRHRQGSNQRNSVNLRIVTVVFISLDACRSDRELENRFLLTQFLKC